jgi:hypothetical protein
MYKRILLTLTIIVCGAGALYAGDFRIGGIVGAEVFDVIEEEEIKPEFDSRTIPYPGLYWELIPNEHFGFGMTYLIKFNRQASALNDIDYNWYFDWIASFDFRYHFLHDTVFDPFLEAGIGNAGRVDITSYDYGQEGERDELLMSLFGQAGGGIALQFSELHVGAKILYRFLNRPLPATTIDTYPLTAVHLSVFAGVTF